MSNKQYARVTDMVPDAPTPKPPKKKRKKSGVFNRIITVISVLVLLVSGGICIKYFKEAYDSKRLAQNIVEMTSAAETYPAEPAEVQPQYRAAYNENNDLVGWIVIPNTAINHPVVQATDNGSPLGIGNFPSACASSFNGQYDEIRLRGGTLSADRIKADYDMIVNRDFCTYGKVGK